MSRAAALLSAGLLLAGCGDAPAKTETDVGDISHQIPLDEGFDPNAEFDYGYNTVMASWDPTKSISGAELVWYAPVYDRLLWIDENGELQPMLATEWEPAEDLSSMTLKLREGLEFSDGTPFNAEAVKYNLERAAAPESLIASELYQVTGVDVVDEYTVKINVTGGLGSLSVALAARPGSMVSPTAAKAGTLEDKPVGIGPYVVTETVPGDYATYEKVDGYWDPDSQNVAKRTYHYMPDDQTRYNALLSGEVDGVSMSPTMLDDADRAGLQSTARPTGLFLFLAVNSAEDSLDNPEVMKALNMAIDRESISEGLYDGLCVPQIQPFPADSPGYSEKIGPGLDVFSYDPEAAKQILDDEGVDGLSLDAVTPNVTIYTKFAEAVQEQLGEIGIDVSVAPKPSAQIVEDFAITKSANAFASVYTGIADPSGVIQSFLTPESRYNPGESNYDQLVELAAEGAAPLDTADRQAAYAEFMDAWIEAPPHIVPVCMIYIAASFSDEVSGVLQTAGGITDLLRDVAMTPA